MNAARLAARVLALLGPAAGPVAIAGPRANRLARELPGAADGDATAAVVVFLGAAPSPDERQATLRGMQSRLPPGAPLVLVDHNQPRAQWRRAVALFPLLAGGLRPSRARYPAARELAALGFAVERLRLAAGERVQLVVARRV